jgi:lactoylglutathione lyase
MKIDHIALWTHDLDRLKDFYSQFFDCKVSDRYDNNEKQFSSYFLSFNDGGARIEIMKRGDINDINSNERIGLAHFSISVGTKTQVDILTAKLVKAGFKIYSYPRTSGDGYYESVVFDPDNNKVELMAYKDYEIILSKQDDL